MRYQIVFSRKPFRSVPGVVAAAFLATVATAGLARASCNIIPGTTKSFRGALGSLDRPFAEPGSWVELNLSGPCSSASPGFLARAEDHVVTVAFQPPAGDSNVIVLASDCAALQDHLLSCRSTTGVASARCLPASTALPPFDLDVLDRDGERDLRFRFPDTDAFFEGADDQRTFAGPAAIAVTTLADPLPCSLATTTCQQQTGLLACVDKIYATDNGCSTNPHSTFSHFTALPPANDYHALCTEPSPPCVGTAAEIHFAVDAEGNILLPMDWRGVLLGQNIPIARMLRGSSTVEPFQGSGGSIVVPGNGFLKSFSPEGGLLPPLLDPQRDPQAAGMVTLFGSADSPKTVLRVARRSPLFLQCSGGDNAGLPCVDASDCPAGSCVTASCRNGSQIGQPCSSDADCPGGECGSALFEFRDRLEMRVGPVVIPRFADSSQPQSGVCEAAQTPGALCTGDVDCATGDRCVLYTLAAEDPVPLDGLFLTTRLLVFVISEATAGVDLNGDADMVDSVAIMKDRTTGLKQLLSVPAACAVGGSSQGPAVVRVAFPPFTLPAVAVEGDIAALLESEQGDNGCDANSDGDAADAVLRVFRLGGAELTDTAASLEAADPSTVVGGRSLLVSNGRVFYRGGDGTLEVLDTSSGALSKLCPATLAAVAAGRTAFLRPESASGTVLCPAGSLNGDADQSDLVTYLWQGSGAVENLGRAAVSVALSETWLAALISEAGEGVSGTDLNGDTDAADDVVALYPLGSGSGSWLEVAQAADTLDVVGSTVAFLTPEAAEGARDLDGDGDALDRVLQVYQAGSGSLVNLGLAAEEFVLGPKLLAFRAREAEQGRDLNADGDTADDILEVYDIASGTTLNTQQTVVPCTLEACDPKLPYRVLDDTVRFLTLESAAGKDLNGDGDTNDLVLQIFNATMALANTAPALVRGAPSSMPYARTVAFGGLVAAGPLTSVGSVAASPRLGTLLRGEDGAIAYVNTGRCIEDLDRGCSETEPCGSGEICNEQGSCERAYGPCRSDADCAPASRCEGEQVLATAADSDGDELPDPFDNCPSVANILQRDDDGDGIGNACQQSCVEGQGCSVAGSCTDAGCSTAACGDPAGQGTTTATSALYILQSAVGLQACDPCICNVDGVGTTTASDALLALRNAVGQGQPLHCPVCNGLGYP